MAARDWRADEGGGRARVYGACAGCVGARKLGSRQLVEANTPPSQRARNRTSVNSSGELCESSRKMAVTSRWAAIGGRRPRPIRKKIIGRSMSAFRRRFARGSGLQHLRRTLALLHQPAGQHGGSILLEPLVEKRADFLPEIRSMAQTREFVALQRVTRGREKELPRGLGLLAVHTALLDDNERCVK